MASKKTDATGAGRPQSLPTGKRNNADVMPPLVPNDQLRRENEDLRQQLNETKQMMAQLLSESPKENYGRRRVLLLKAQLYQTERQLLLLQDGMARRTGTLWEAENILKNVKSQCQSWATSESDLTSPSSAHVTIARPQLFRILEDVEKARSALFRRLTRDGGEEENFRHLCIPNRFSSATSDDRPDGGDNEASVIDVLTGKKPMFNLRRVATLESEIFSCFEEVAKFAINLSCLSSSPNANGLDQAKLRRGYLPLSILQSSAVIKGLSQEAARTKECLERLGNSLVDLSILIPLSTHRSSSRSRSTKTNDTRTSSSSSSSSTVPPCCLGSPIGAKTILSKFPRQTIAKSRLKEVAAVLQSYVSVCETQKRVDDLCQKFLREELDDMARLFEIQNEYVEEVIGLAERSYNDFYAELTSKFHSPLAQILTTFEKVEAEPTEDNLRFFLLGVRENYGPLLALRQYLQQRQREDQPEKSNRSSIDPFKILRLNFHEKMEMGLEDLTTRRECRAAQILKSRSELNDLQCSFSNVGVAN